MHTSPESTGGEKKKKNFWKEKSVELRNVIAFYYNLLHDDVISGAEYRYKIGNHKIFYPCYTEVLGEKCSIGTVEK